MVCLYIPRKLRLFYFYVKVIGMPFYSKMFACVLVVGVSFSLLVNADTLTLPDLTIEAPMATDDTQAGFEITNNQSVIASSGSQTVSSALALHPMIQTQSHSSNASQNTIALHGFGDNASVNTLLTLDGMPFISASLIGPNFNALLPGAISDYTLLPGSYGTLYGNQAIGGVVKLNTVIPSEPVADFSLSLGNHDQHGVSFVASETDDVGQAVRLGASMYNNDHDQPNSQQQDYLMNLQWSKQSDDQSSGINLIAYHTTIHLPSSQLWGSAEEPGDSSAVSTTEGYLLNAYHQRWLNADWQWLTHLLWFEDQQTCTSLSSVSDQSSVLWKNDWLYGARWKMGWDISYDTFDTDNSKASYDSDEYITSAYARYTQPISSKVSMAVGARGAWQGIGATSSTNDHLYQHNTAFVNEQSLYWKPKSAWRFFLRRDMNFRMPKGKEEVWSADGTVHELSVQTGIAYEAGFNWKCNNDAIRLAVFHLDIDNELAYTLFPLPYGEVTNLPPTRRVGIDLSAERVLSDGLSSSVEMSWVNPTIRSGEYEGNQIPGVSPFNGGVAVTYGALPRWNMTVMESYHSSFYASDDFNNTGDKMPDYWLTNARWQKQWNTTTLTLRADNLLDKHYVRYGQYYSDGSIRYYAADGFMMLATMKISLGK
ncbi:MAG: hypothetical protein CL816_04660 [Coxiellaceae bacterium]|nr:hypothetical protein [Coxiellaceae bacterium]|tara:strand:+ start:224 stop:2182 length:1959 start_codon:yes stop_codon:yes gene_type:complete